MQTTRNIDEFQLPYLIARLWALRIPMVLSALLLGAAGVAASFYTGTAFTYEALLRIEPEVSTTGEQTSLEAEIDVLKSWNLTATTLEDMQRNVWVRRIDAQYQSPLAMAKETIHARINGLKLPNDIQRVPAPRVEQFMLTGDAEAWYGREFVLTLTPENTFALSAPSGEVICTVAAKQPCQATLRNLEKKVTLQAMFTAGTAQSGNGFVITPVSLDTMIRTMRDQIGVTRMGFRERSGLLMLSVSYGDAVYAQQFLERYIDHYLRQAFDRSSLGKLKALENLEHAATELRENVQQAEQKMAQFQRKHNIGNVSARSSVLAENLNRIERAISDVDIEISKLAVSYLPSHPSMQALENTRTIYQEKLVALQKEIDGLPEKERVTLTLQRAIDTQNKILDTNTKNIAQLRADVQMITGYARLISPPNVKGRALFRRAPIYAIMGIILGAAPWMMLAALQSLPPLARIRSPRDIARFSSAPLVASMGKDRKLKRRLRLRKRGWVSPSPKDASASTRRMIEELTQQSRFVVSEKGGNKIVAMSALDGRGDSAAVACLFAESMATTRRTLLIDMNMGAPSLHEIYRVESSPGMSDVISAQANLDKAMHATSVKNLFLIPAGTQTHNFRLLHEIQRLQSLLDVLNKGFESIVMCYPALQPHMCHPRLFQHADMVLLHVAHGMHIKHLSGIAACSLDKHAGTSILYTMDDA